jgi:hypothetical protein
MAQDEFGTARAIYKQRKSSRRSQQPTDWPLVGEAPPAQEGLLVQPRGWASKWVNG